MINEEKIVLAHLKREMIKRHEGKDERLMYVEDVLALIAQYEAGIVLCFEDDYPVDEGLPFLEVHG